MSIAALHVHCTAAHTVLEVMSDGIRGLSFTADAAMCMKRHTSGGFNAPGRLSFKLTILAVWPWPDMLSYVKHSLSHQRTSNGGASGVEAKLADVAQLQGQATRSGSGGWPYLIQIFNTHMGQAYLI